MAYTYPVKWIKETMRGAPAMSGTSGVLIAALDAFLLTGWGTATALSVTVSGGVATAEFSPGVFFEDFAVVAISGAVTPALLNGEARVLSHTSSAITFETDAPDGAATGAISIRYAPVGGWEKQFSAANKACYRSIDVMSPGHVLRVDDSGTTTARVVGYESMSDVDTGSGPFPTNAMFSGGGYWHKSDAANATAKRYALAADSRAFLPALESSASGASALRSSNVRGFGDPVPLAPAGDTWGTFLSAAAASAYSLANGALSGGMASATNGGFTAAPRPLSGLGTAVFLDVLPSTGAPAKISGADGFAGVAPSDVDGEIKISRVFLKQKTADGSPRSVVPGVLYCPQRQVTASVTTGDIVAGSGEFFGRKLLAVGCGDNPGTVTGIAFIDITGPWRP